MCLVKLWVPLAGAVALNLPIPAARFPQPPPRSGSEPPSDSARERVKRHSTCTRSLAPGPYPAFDKFNHHVKGTGLVAIRLRRL